MKNDELEFHFASAVTRIEDAKELLQERIETVAVQFWEYFKFKNPEKAEIVENLLGYIPAKVYLEKIFNADHGVWAARLCFEKADGRQSIYIVSHSEYWDSDDEKADDLPEDQSEAVMAVYYSYPDCAREITIE